MKGAKLFLYISIGLLFTASAYQLFKGDKEPDFEHIPNPEKVEGKIPVGYDYSSKSYIYKDDPNYKREPKFESFIDIPPPQPIRATNISDEEIRMLREIRSYKGDGSYIYTPGRRVKSREREMQDYIEDNIDEILENHTP